MDGIKIITTKDGSHSLLNTQLDEPYHSIHGALSESLHVFIKNGLDVIVKRGLPVVRILEIGFGTGLNALLSLRVAQNEKINIEYTALENNPIDLSLIEKLNFTQLGELSKYKSNFIRLHETNWDKPIIVNQFYTLNKWQVGLHEFRSSVKFDLIYFDAFAPDKQPEMWTSEALALVESLMSPNGIFVTYCAKGEVKRKLRSVGLTVNSLPGPPGKREMVRAIKLP